MIYFETERLIFRDWEDQDLDEFQRMNQDPKVMQYFVSTLTEEETDQFYHRIQEEFRTCRYSLFAVETRHNNDFIGFIGFHLASFPSEFTPCIEIGWRLKKEVWGNGYATEGAKACLNYGFHTLGLDQIYSFTSKINTPSENVMKKIGMVKAAEFEHPNVPTGNPLRQHVLYSISSNC